MEDQDVVALLEIAKKKFGEFVDEAIAAIAGVSGSAVVPAVPAAPADTDWRTDCAL